MLGEKLRALRLQKGLTQVQLAEMVGISNNLYNKYEKKDVRPPYETLVKLASALNTSLSVLLDEIAVYPSEAVIDMPIIGSVRGGMDGNVVQEETGETRPIAASALHGRPDEYFLLRVRGDSMYPEILDGDCVLVKKTDSVESGSMAVVLYDGDYATVKWVKYVEGEDWLDLIPNNTQYAPVRIEGADLEQCHVLGEVVDILRKPRKKVW